MTDDDRLIFKEFIEQLIAALNKHTDAEESRGQPDHGPTNRDDYDTPPQFSGAGSDARSTMSEALVLVRNISQAGGALPPLLTRVVWNFNTLVDGGNALKNVLGSLKGVGISFGKSLWDATRHMPTKAGGLIQASIDKSIGRRAERLGADAAALREANSIFKEKGMGQEGLIEARNIYRDLAIAKGHTPEQINKVLYGSEKGGKNLTEAFVKAMNIGTGKAGNAARLGGGLLQAGLKGLGKGLLGGLFSGPGLMLASMYGQDFWERWQKGKDAAMKSAVAQQTHLNKLMLIGLQQESQMRQAAFRAEEEMDRKRFENLRSLSEAKTKMNEGDLAMQERIMQIEKQRTAAQKEGELAKQRASQLKDLAQQTFEHLKEEGRVQDTAKRRGGIWATTKGLTGSILQLAGIDVGIGTTEIEDERGNLLDRSVGEAVERHGFFGRAKDRALQSIMATAAQARENAMQAVENDFKEHIARYEEFAATIAATQVSSLAPQLAEARKKLDDAEKQLTEYFQAHEQSIAADRIANMSFEEAKTSGKLKQDSFTGEYTIMDREGAIKVIQDESDWANYQAENRSGDAETYERMAKANEESMKLQERMVAYQQASVALVQEQVKKQEEILKNLRDAATKNYQSDMTDMFGSGKRKTAQEAEEIFGNRRDEMQRDLILSTAQYAGDAQAAEEYKLNADLQIQANKDTRRINAQLSKEWYDFRKKQDIELYELEHKNAVEEHKVWLQNQTKIFQTYIEAAKAQRDAYFRTLEKQMSRDIIGLTGYGRSQSEVAQDLQLNRIGQYYDQLKTNFESDYSLQKAASDASFEEAVIADQSEFNTKQAQERLKVEEEAIKNKFNYERDLAKQEHQVRIELIKAEYEYRRALDQAEKDKDRNNLASLNKIASNTSKEDMDKLTDSVFKGKKYDDLTKDERQELFDTIAIQQEGLLNEAIEASGKRRADYVDSNGNQLEGEALYQAVRADAQKTYDNMSESEKREAKGMRLHDVLEDLGTGVGGNILEASEEAGKILIAATERAGENLENSQDEALSGFDDVSAKATANEVKLKKDEADLKSKQEKESAEHEEGIKQQRAYRDAAWDNVHQSGLKNLELRQKQDEENYKMGIRQFARRETTASDAFAAKLGATSGGDWSAAILKEGNEQQFNNALDDMEVRHADELASARANGASESDIAKLQARQQLEYKELENQKKVSDTMLQRRIGSETGSTSDVMSMWEQIQASAFGHIEDPTVSAIDSLREQQWEQGDAMLRATLDQTGRLGDEVEYSALIAQNTAALVADARKTKNQPKEKKEKEVVKEDTGLAERRS